MIHLWSVYTGRRGRRNGWRGTGGEVLKRDGLEARRIVGTRRGERVGGKVG